MDDYDDIDPPNGAQNSHNPHNPAPGGDVGHGGEGAAGADERGQPGSDATGGNVGRTGEPAEGDEDLDEHDDPDSFDTADPTPGLSHKQEQAILALLAEPTVARAAKTCKVGVRTLHRWLREEVFGKAYRLARRETFAQAVSLTQRYASLAVQTLAKVMTDESSPPASRVAAATGILKFARDSIELDDLADRVEALERSGKEKAA
jgi:hypothetical protein